MILDDFPQIAISGQPREYKNEPFVFVSGKLKQLFNVALKVYRVNARY